MYTNYINNSFVTPTLLTRLRHFGYLCYDFFKQFATFHSQHTNMYSYLRESQDLSLVNQKPLSLTLSLSKMELLPKKSYGNLKRFWRRRSYQRIDDETRIRRNVKVTRFGGGERKKHSWKIKALPKLRFLMRPIGSAPLKLLTKVKNAYMEMMLNLAGNVGSLTANNAFGTKRIPKERKVDTIAYSGYEVEERLVLEIYKALAASRGVRELTAAN